ncbi:peptide MFS transporter [Fulvivirga sp.]|uniref:peptide MFS transporter n=1 Tax=Fulvivirga sp. TaxID=1931237 RepID=UPI0032EE07E7
MSSITIDHPDHGANGKQLWGHPMGLYYLFFVELWERFSYYGMRALLTLYLAAPLLGDNPGLGWDDARTYSFYGTYTMLVYLATIPGGLIADRFLGQKKTVLIGGILLCIGHTVLAIEAMWAFYTGIAFIIAGVGGLKSNISTMVGGLYKPGDDRRDKGFYIFYIGINIGAFAGALATGWAAVQYGWHYGFGLAGIGMLVGQIMFMYGQKYLKGVGDFEGAADSINKELMKKPLTKIEKDRMLVMFLSFLIIIVFWGAFEQAGGLMNLYAEQKTDRFIGFLDFTVPAAWFQSVNAFFIMTFGTVVAGFWYWWKKQGKESSSLFKMAVGVIVMGFGFLFMSGASMQYQESGSSAMYWLVLAYLLHTLGELCASPVALSFITKLAPVKYASFMMGAYFAATGLGNKLAGMLGVWSTTLGEFELFTVIFVFCAIFGLLVIAILKPLKRLTHGAEEVSPVVAIEDEGYSRPDKVE